MKYFKKLVGNKVYLSPLNNEDVNIYTKWMNDLDITKGFGGIGESASLNNCEHWFENISRQHHYAIVLDVSDEFIGVCGFNSIDHLRQVGEVSILIGDRKNRGQGYGTEALNLLIGYGFEYLNLNNIMLTVYDFNADAIKLYEKCGFKVFGKRTKVMPLNGEYYDQIYMEMTDDDYFDRPKIKKLTK